MQGLLPWELTDKEIHNFINELYIVEEKSWDDVAFGCKIYRFSFTICAGVQILYLIAAITLWFKKSTNSQLGLHYFLTIEPNSSKPSHIIFFKKEDAILFKCTVNVKSE